VRFSISQRFEVELAISRLASLKTYVSPQDLKVAFEAAKDFLGASQNEPRSTFNMSEKKNFYRESLEELNQKKNIEIESTKPLSEKIDNIAKLKASVVNRFEKENGVLLNLIKLFISLELQNLYLKSLPIR